MSYYILNKYTPFFTEVVSVVYLGFLNIHMLCAGGDQLSLRGGGVGSHLHVSFSPTPKNDER